MDSVDPVLVAGQDRLQRHGEHGGAACGRGTKRPDEGLFSTGQASVTSQRKDTDYQLMELYTKNLLCLCDQLRHCSVKNKQ